MDIPLTNLPFGKIELDGRLAQLRCKPVEVVMTRRRQSWKLASVLAVASISLSIETNACAVGFGQNRFRAGAWRLTVFTDGFSGHRRCRLVERSNRALVVGGLLQFNIGLAIEPSEATVRIDEGLAIRWRDMLPEIASVDPAFVEHRTPRHVSIPLARLQDANSLAVSPAFGGRPRNLSLNGLPSLLDIATKQGCKPQDMVER